jgi:hypothetical protein
MSTDQNPPVSLPEHDEDTSYLTSWAPTRKWIATAVTGAAAVVSSWIVTSGFDATERGMVAALVSALAVAYFKSDDDA